MLFDQWSEDAYKMLEWWYKLLVFLVTHPERLVVGNGAVDQLYAKAWPLAVTITISFLLAAASFMIVAFGRGVEYVAKAIKVAIIVFVCSMVARELSPFLLARVGEASAAIIGDTTTLAFPNLGKGFGPWVGHSLALVVVVLMVVFVIALAPMIIITAGLIVLSFALRVFGAVGEKQWQLFLSAFVTSHIVGVVIFAVAIRLAHNAKDQFDNAAAEAIVIIVIFTLAIVLEGASFYLFYVVASHVAGGRLRADSHSDGGEIDRVGSSGGDRAEPQVHQGDVHKDNDGSQGSPAPADGAVPPSHASVDGRIASSGGLDISLRDTSPTGTPPPVGSNGSLKSSGQTPESGATPQPGLVYPVTVTTPTERRQSETEVPQWKEESPVPPPLSTEPTQEIPVTVSYQMPLPESVTPIGVTEREPEASPMLSGAEYIKQAYGELGLEEYRIPPSQPSPPERTVEHGSEIGIEFD
ncbi:MAG: hypothetical protein WBO49_01300 [Candidatus Saccharimonas sp.]